MSPRAQETRSTRPTREPLSLAPAARRALLAWYRREGRDLPWRRSRDPYAVWISEVMLQQTTVAAVIPYYARFLARFPDLPSLAASDEQALLALWSGLGYYRRARNLRAAARVVMEAHGGRFPSTLPGIAALPGIGRYTAGAIGSICFGLRAPAVDGNVVRVLSRYFALESAPSKPGSFPAPGRTSSTARTLATTRTQATAPTPATGGSTAGKAPSADIWRIAEASLPARSPGDWNQALMELGARICRTASPECGRCPLAHGCLGRASGDPGRFPAPRRRPGPVAIRAFLVVVSRRGKVLMVRREDDGPLGGLWELPGTLAGALEASRRVKAPAAQRSSRAGTALAESQPMGSSGTGEPPAAQPGPAAILRAALGLTPVGLRREATVRHAVTHRRIELEVWRAEAPASLPARLRAGRGDGHLWVAPAGLAAIPVGAASRKALAAVQAGAGPPPSTGPRAPARPPAVEGAKPRTAPAPRAKRPPLPRRPRTAPAGGAPARAAGSGTIKGRSPSRGLVEGR